MSEPLPNASIAREREIFLQAMKKASSVERAEFVEAACGNDERLRLRLLDLLREQEQVGDFLQTPALSSTPTTQLVANEKPGDRIDRYKLLQEIGEGGAGVVYMAEQEEPVRRRVALKVIKLGMDTKSVIARFEAERQAVAMMDHPNIAKVFDAGTTEAGRPFFVMELVRGIKITDYCDQNQLPTAERLGLFTQVCQAIQHAHQKGIIHRDVKPSNILVTLHDGKPVPKVIDFGIAKATEARLTEKTLFTEFTTFIGTPAYMSPEQAEMSGLDIDTRSDIYALGVLLYELLTGKTPFDAEALYQMSLDECRRTIREKEPDRPSTRLATLISADLTTTAKQRQTEPPRLIHSVTGDLDWIAMKCLEKDRTRRYATANDLASDVLRYLNGEPVLARPPSSLYRFQKFARKHRGAIAAAAAIVITLLAGAGISARQAIRATKAEHVAQGSQNQERLLRRQAELDRARAEQEEASAYLNEYVADINLAQQALAAGNLGRAVQLLEKHQPQTGQQDLRGFEWRYLWRLCKGDQHVSLPPQEGPVQSIAFSPNAELLAVGQPQRCSLWSVASKTLVTNLMHAAISMAFPPDGRQLITASIRNTRVWSIGTWTQEKELTQHSGPIALSRDGKRLATASWDNILVLDTDTWKERRRVRSAFGPTAFSPDAKLLVTDTRNGLTIWNIEGGTETVLENSTNLLARGGPWFRPDRGLAFSPDGKSVVAARNNLSEKGVFVLSIWDAESGREVATMPPDPEHVEHTGAISALAFSPDGDRLATASMDHSIRVWDYKTRKCLFTFQGHFNEVWTLAFSPDGQMLASGAKDGTVKLWPMRRPEREDVLVGRWDPQAFSTDSRKLAVLGRSNNIALLNLRTREVEQQFQLEMPPERGPFRPKPAFDLAEGTRTLAQGLEDGTLKLWNTESSEFTNLKIGERMVEYLVLSPDGRICVSTGRGQRLRWMDVRTGTSQILESEAGRVLFSPDSRTMAAFQRGNIVEIWDVPSCTLRTNFNSDVQFRFSAAFSPDGRILAVVCVDDSVRLWDTATAKELGVCIGHKQGVLSVAFSPDGKTLATASDDSTLKLWNVATQQELLTIRRLGGTLMNLMFSPDGSILVGSTSFFSQTGELRFYHAPPLSQIDAEIEAAGPKPARRVVLMDGPSGFPGRGPGPGRGSGWRGGPPADSGPQPRR